MEDGDGEQNGTELWERLKHSIKPLRKKHNPPTGRIKEIVINRPPLSNKGRRVKATHRPVTELANIDKNLARKLRSGKYPVDVTLDLHGMTQEEAFSELCGMVENSRIMGRRCILVVTGKGRQGQGVLREKLPLWVESPTLIPHIYALIPASPGHGGDGAFYLMLRR